ncbi:hypothetical protein [Pontibacter brevis]
MSELLSELPLVEEVLPDVDEPAVVEPLVVEPDAVDPDDFEVLVSDVLPSFLEEELDLAFVEDDLEPEAVVLPLLSLDADEVEPVDAVEPVPLVLPVVLPDVDELGVLDVFPDEFDDSVEF